MTAFCGGFRAGLGRIRERRACCVGSPSGEARVSARSNASAARTRGARMVALGAIPFPHQDAASLVQRTAIYLGSHDLSSPSAIETLCGALNHTSSQIESINLDSTNLNSSVLSQLAPAIATSASLQHVSLFGNSITSAGATALFDALANNASQSKLVSLSLARNCIGPSAAPALARMLAAHQTLTTLYLMHQAPAATAGSGGDAGESGGLGDQGAECLARGIAENARNGGLFSFVNLVGNSITERGFSALENARIPAKHVVYPLDPYPGKHRNPKQTT